MMHVNFELPDEFAQRLQAKWQGARSQFPANR